MDASMTSRDLAGKTVLIIGASRGIGAATALAFARHDAQLVLASRDLEGLKAVVETLPAGTQARVIRTDITLAGDIARSVEFTVEQFGRLDIAFNNAGVSPKRTPLAELSDEAFDDALNTNVRGVFIAMKHQIRAMLKTGGGSIVNTGSISSMVALPQMAAYCTSKHALAGLTKAAALDYAAHNVRVNLVAPGPVDTRMFQSGAGATGEGRERIASSTPMRRISRPEEIAEAVLWIASPAASYITGAILPVDGGYTLP
jgi:NAD(P)-dependent dehydrogenase (short-subunit alcohol dehydrogenase family)